MPPVVYQIVPHFSFADAVGNQILRTGDLLRRLGCETQIFADNWDPRLNNVVRPTTDYLSHANREHWVILHYCICGHGNMIARDSGGKLVLYYHNVTPARFFHGYEPTAAACCAQARWQLKEFIGRGATIAASEFNRSELESLGFEVQAVAPYIVKLESLHEGAVSAESRMLRERYAAPGRPTWLYVGRIAPNKRITDLVRSFHYYRTHIAPTARLLLVGGRAGGAYDAELNALIAELELGDSVVFPGAFPAELLGTFYLLADVYVCLSEHEGFCVPLLEAMSFDVPIVAYGSTGVPTTLGGSGVLLHRKNAPLVAEVVHEVLSTPDLRAAVVAHQRQRLADFHPDLALRQLHQALLSAGIPLPQPGAASDA